jgi:Ca2+/H+ antiporter, TMEM165/GDT1 family
MTELLADAGWTGYLLVLVAAATPVVEILFVVPAGIGVGLEPVPVALLALTGNLTTVALVVVAGDRLRAWWRGRRGRGRMQGPAAGGGAAGGDAGDGGASDGGASDGDASDGDTADGAAAAGRAGRARRLAERFGVPGLGLLAPLLTGSHIGAMAALGLGASRRRTLLWMSIGLAVWTVATAVAAVLGLELIRG